MLECFSGHGHPDDPTPIFHSPSPPTPSSAEAEQKYEVVILGAGQSGLSLAGRLGALGISYLLLEKGEVGGSWTGKYDSVKQHTVREMNNLPFERTYRESDPVLLPAAVVKRGFEEYVEKYRINVWCGAETESAIRKEGGWVVNVKVEGLAVRVETRHLVFAMGAGVSVPNFPVIDGREEFQGVVIHQSEFKNARAWKGKKGVVVGTGTTAHDVAQDMLDSGLESVTMIQRGKTPVFPVEWIVHGQSSKSSPTLPTLTQNERLH
jgi:cation diffusion facilitator CzcD-associated flavoprotein CzcO